VIICLHNYVLNVFHQLIQNILLVLKKLCGKCAEIHGEEKIKELNKEKEEINKQIQNIKKQINDAIIADC